MRGSASIASITIFVLLGPIIWATHLLIVYGGHASLCAADDRLPYLDASHLPFLLTSATVAVLIALVPAVLWPERLRQMMIGRVETDEAFFLTRAMRLLALMSFFGIAWAAVAIVALPACLQLR